MKAWGVLVLLAAIVGTEVFAVDLVFPEDVQRQSSSRIVSGWEAQEGQIPWQLSLRMVNGSGSVFSCGGSIIHPEWGMTAAHCTATRYTMVLRAGAVNLWRPELLFETTEYYNHPLYINELQSVVQPHDISLLKFPRAITFTDRVQPIRLQRDADKNRNYAGVRLEASGWGQTWSQGPSPENLQWVYLRGVANLGCWFSYGGSAIIVDSTICANYYNVTSQSTCQGDSGGPLVDLEEDGKYTMVGVASFVALAGCHVPDFPAGFIRPGHYHDWYRQVTGINFDWEHGDSSSSESDESSEETPEPDTEESEEVKPESESEESEEVPEPESEESQEVVPEPESEESEEVVPEPESEESEEVIPEPESEESQEVVPEPEPEDSEEVVPEPESEESQEVVPEPEPEDSEEVAPEPETEESQEVAPEPETEESEEVVPQPEPETEESEEAAPEPETEEEVAPEPETEEGSEEVAPEPETEEEVAPEPETEEGSEEVAPEPETEEVSEEAAPEEASEEASLTPEEARFGFPSFAKFFV